MLDEFKPKLNIVGLDPGQQQTAKGEIEIGFFTISEIRPFVKFGGAAPVAGSLLRRQRPGDRTTVKPTAIAVLLH